MDPHGGRAVATAALNEGPSSVIAPEFDEGEENSLGFLILPNFVALLYFEYGNGIGVLIFFFFTENSSFFIRL